MRGLLLAAAALALFLTLSVYANRDAGPLVRLDEAVALRLKEHREASPVVRGFFCGVTELGSPKWLLALAAVVAAALAWRGRWARALAWLLTMSGATLINVLKPIWERPRPWDLMDPWVQHETKTSFPSGHAMGSLIAYGMLTYLLMGALPRRRERLAVAAGAGLLILAIGFSRAYLAAHWVSDVLGGFAAGAFWLASCITVVETVRRRRLERPAPDRP